MSRHKPDYEEIARLEKELGIGVSPEPQKPIPPPTPPPPPPKPKVVDLAAYVAHKKRTEQMLFHPGAVYSASSTSMPYYGPVTGGAKLRTVTIYGPDGKPLYETPAQ